MRSYRPPRLRRSSSYRSGLRLRPAGSEARDQGGKVGSLTVTISREGV